MFRIRSLCTIIMFSANGNFSYTFQKFSVYGMLLFLNLLVQIHSVMHDCKAVLCPAVLVSDYYSFYLQWNPVYSGRGPYS